MLCCSAAVEGADQLSLMDLMTDGSSNNTPPFPSQMKNTNVLFSNKAEAFRWNHHFDRKHDQYGDKKWPNAAHRAVVRSDSSYQ